MLNQPSELGQTWEAKQNATPQTVYYCGSTIPSCRLPVAALDSFFPRPTLLQHVAELDTVGHMGEAHFILIRPRNVF